MSVTYDDWRTACNDMELWARTVTSDPNNKPARANLLAACDRAATLRKREKAAHAIEDTRPGEPPIETDTPPPVSMPPEAPPPEPTRPAFKARLPYPNDDD